MNRKSALDLVVFKFIDANLDLYGSINSKQLCQQFHMHRTVASRLITRYRDAIPSNTRFNVSLKQHVKSYTFRKKFLKGSSLEFLTSVEIVFGPTNSQ